MSSWTRTALLGMLGVAASSTGCSRANVFAITDEPTTDGSVGADGAKTRDLSIAHAEAGRHEADGEGGLRGSQLPAAHSRDLRRQQAGATGRGLSYGRRLGFDRVVGLTLPGRHRSRGCGHGVSRRQEGPRWHRVEHRALLCRGRRRRGLCQGPGDPGPDHRLHRSQARLCRRRWDRWRDGLLPCLPRGRRIRRGGARRVGSPGGERGRLQSVASDHGDLLPRHRRCRRAVCRRLLLRDTRHVDHLPRRQGDLREMGGDRSVHGLPVGEDSNGCSTYSSCQDGVEVVLCTKPEGHQDPGDASVAWPVLKRHPL